MTQLPLRRELARKGLHLLTAVIPIAYAMGVPRRPLAVSLAAGAAVALGVELLRARSVRVGAAFDQLVGSLLRAHERRRWSGATWLLLALLGLTLAAPRDVAIAGMWALAVGDAAAAVVGRWLGRPGSGRPGKTTAGSLACFAATLLGALLIAHLSMGESVIAAASATAAERPAGWLDDNVRIALAVLAGILLWRMAFS